MDSSKNKQSKKSGFERKEINGKVNPKYVDLLDEDKPLAGQKFVCMSFCSPEKILKEKEIFFFEEFLKNWDFNKSMEKFLQFINFISFKYNLSFEDLNKDFKDFAIKFVDAIRTNDDTDIKSKYGMDFNDVDNKRIINNFIHIIIPSDLNTRLNAYSSSHTFTWDQTNAAPVPPPNNEFLRFKIKVTSIPNLHISIKKNAVSQPYEAKKCYFSLDDDDKQKTQDYDFTSFF